MKYLLIAAGLAAAASANPALAQEQDDTSGAFDGVKVGATIDYRRQEAKYTAPTLTDRVDDQSGGAGGRAFVGYDKTFGIGLLGVEAGVGRGGRVLKGDFATGTYRLHPKWSWDASARFGVLPTQDVLLYGRAGYGWMRTSETIAYTAAGRAPYSDRETRGGFLYGFGAEVAVAKNFALRTEFDQINFGDGLKSARLQFGGAFRF